MEPVRLRLGELLVDARIITKEQLDEVLAMQEQDGRRLGTLLVECEFVNETQLTQILSQQLSVPWVSLYHVDFSKRLLSMVPDEIARKYCIVPIYVRHVRGQGDTLYVAMDDPTNLDALRECASWAGLPTRAMIASPTDIRRAIDVYYGPDPAAPAPAEPSPHEAAPAGEPPDETAGPPAGSPAPDLAPGPPESADPPQPTAGPLEADPAQSAPVAKTDEAPHAESAVAAPDLAHQPSPELHEVQFDADAAPVVEAGESSPSSRQNDVSIEVGEELSLEEVLAQRKSARPDSLSDDKRAKIARMMSLTLLDGTTLALPVSRKGRSRKGSLVGSMHDELAQGGSPRDSATGPAAYSPRAPRADAAHGASEPPQARQNLLAALQEVAPGLDQDVLGPGASWETVFVALLGLLLRKGLISEEELIEQLKKT